MDELLTYLSLLLILYAVGRRYVWRSLPSIGAILRSIPWTPPQAEARAAARRVASLHTTLRRVAHRDMLRRRAMKARKRSTIPAYHQAIPPAVHTNTTPQGRDIIKTAPLTDVQCKVVQKLLEKGASANDLYALLGGDRNARLAEIREIRAVLNSERLAAEIAPLTSNQEPIPPMEPLPEAA